MEGLARLTASVILRVFSSTTGLDLYWRWDLCRSRVVHGLGRPLGWALSGGGRQMPEFRGLSGRMGAVWPDLLISIRSGPRLLASGVRGIEWALFAIVGGID